jgi:hypothetical protein
MTTYSSQPDETTGIDTFLDNVNTGTNYGTNGVLYSGEWNGGANIFRTLIKFDLSSIPVLAIASSATLSLWTTADSSNNARDKSLFRVLRDWVEAQATWTAWKTGSNWTTAGCGSGGNDADLTNVWAVTNMANNVANDTQIDFVFTATGITELNKILSGANANYGWLLKTTTEADDEYGFASSTGATAARRPKLVIEYVFGGNVIIWSSQ